MSMRNEFKFVKTVMISKSCKNHNRSSGHRAYFFCNNTKANGGKKVLGFCQGNKCAANI